MSGKRIIDGLNEMLNGAPCKVYGFDPGKPDSEKTTYRVYLGQRIWWEISEREYLRLQAQHRRRETKLRLIKGGRISDER